MTEPSEGLSEVEVICGENFSNKELSLFKFWILGLMIIFGIPRDSGGSDAESSVKSRCLVWLCIRTAICCCDERWFLIVFVGGLIPGLKAQVNTIWNFKKLGLIRYQIFENDWPVIFDLC